MTYLGIPVIASKVEVPLYDKILIDVDNNQSIKDSLSTFSAHMHNLGEIMLYASSKDLLLLDEVGTGTSPQEGEAIAYGFICEIVKRHSFALISSSSASSSSSSGLSSGCFFMYLTVSSIA
mgnify:CR=1 FL=1